MHPSHKRAAALTLLLVFFLSLVPSGALALVQPPYATEPASDVWRTYDPALHYYYQQLSEAEKRLFSARYDAIVTGDAELFDYQRNQLDATGVSRVNFVLLYDCPELMITEVDFFTDNYWFTVGFEDLEWHASFIAEALPAALAAVERIRERPEWGETDFEKEIACDRFLVEACEYSLDIGNLVYDTSIRTAYSALAFGQAVCEGYARSAQLALRCLGVPCLFLIGEVNTGIIPVGNMAPGGHAWNLVQISGAWYHYDPTWDDADEADYYEDFFPYLNVSGGLMRLNRSLDMSFSALGFSIPPNTASAGYYYTLKGQVLDEGWRDVLYQAVKDAAAEGRHGLGFYVPDDTTFNEIADECLSHPFQFSLRIALSLDMVKFNEARCLYFCWN
ncbi:MAG: hypothetical protein IJS53_03060 [Clostridia bacterium]|nr:hypothetical protein [Clostridia bacterium]